jgi:hypothetical protein
MKRLMILSDLLLSSKCIRFILSLFFKLGVLSLNLINGFASYALQRGHVHPNIVVWVIPVNFIHYIESLDVAVTICNLTREQTLSLLEIQVSLCLFSVYTEEYRETTLHRP